MAEQNYVRLAAACHCGQPVKLWSGRGRKPKYCDAHPGQLGKGARVRGKCSVEGCAGAHKAQGFCLRHYRQWQRGGVKTDACRCAHCDQEFQPSHVGAIYCSTRCKRAAWVKANPERYKALPSNQPWLCAYFAKYCAGCGLAWGGKREWDLCPACKRAAVLRAAREAARAWNGAKHRAAGRVVRCDECGCAFCPLYGAKHGATPLCVPCAKIRHRRWKSAGGSNIQRAKRAGVVYRYFDEVKVLRRDGWTCQLCGIPTPKEARGSTRPDAPEFDHCIPLAMGGPHIPENGQCLCRSCNAEKADRWCARSVASAVARGVPPPAGRARSRRGTQKPRSARGIACIEAHGSA